MRIWLFFLFGLAQASVWHQTTWHGGPDQKFYEDTTRYLKGEGIVDNTIGEFSLLSGWREIAILTQTKVVYNLIEDINHIIWAATSDNNGKGKVFKSSDSGIEEFDKGNYKKAREEFEKVLALDPKNQKANNYLKRIPASKEGAYNFYLKGIFAYTEENYEIAISYWQEALRLDPKLKNAEKKLKYLKE